MTELLIIDDDKSLCYSLSRVLENKYEVFTANNLNDALKVIDKQSLNLIFLDFILGEEDGLEVLKTIKKQTEIPVVIMTAFGSSKVVIESINLGAVDYLVKPLQIEELESVIEKYSLKKHLHDGHCLEIKNFHVEQNSFIGSSKPTNEILKTVALVSKTSSPVLIGGKSGTGKELIAKLIHQFSTRKDHPFITINCAAIPENLLESELFGYVKGAFSGAVHDKTGKLDLADKGTVFLDEIGDLPMKLQAKLLRFLQEGTIEMLGKNDLKQIDVRVISATNQNLLEKIQKDEFRQDLFYRLNGVSLRLPTLKERKQDLKDLLAYFVRVYSEKYQKPIHCVSKEILQVIENYEWPGNIREFQNVVRKAIILSNSGYLDKSHFEIETATPMETQSNSLYSYFISRFKTNLYQQSIEMLEEELLRETLSKNSSHLSKTAEELGISRVTLNAKIKKYNLG
ncbi:MAG: sigma-54 dependent transcriptional regulator [Deltaproteobacteria bacterium]|nr:sigma-54 dependent transcriptional regulator [Deltaproteobacteria bacterium]